MVALKFMDKDIATFLHHALWVVANENTTLLQPQLEAITKFRKEFEQYCHQNQDRYCKAIAKGGVKLLSQCLN